MIKFPFNPFQLNCRAVSKLAAISFSAALLLIAPHFAQAAAKAAYPKALTNVCKGGVIQGNAKVIVYKTSAPVRTCAAHSCPIAFLRQEPTLIMKQRVALSFATVYSRAGKAIGRCPWRAADGFAGGRYRCTMNTRSLVGAARSSGNSNAIYFPIKGNKCIEVANGNSCIGSTSC